jgi:hypothetical protein
VADCHQCREYERLLAQNECLRAALRDLVKWDERNGGFGELPVIMSAAKAALKNKG